jgi:hypothetical protein
MALVIYTFILASVLGSIWGTKPNENIEAPHGAYDYWIERYQTLIGSGFVIFAVAVAVGQVNESRRQHAATMKLNFRDELEGLQVATEIANSYRHGGLYDFILGSGRRKISANDIEAVAKSKSPHIIDAFHVLSSVVNDGTKYPEDGGNRGLLDWVIEGHPLMGDDKARAARDLAKAINERKDFLRQFMPDLV